MSFETGAAFGATRPVQQVPAGAENDKPAASSADSVAAALLMARSQRRKIEALSERTATTATYALPDGALQTTSYAGPMWQKDDGGQWRDIDTSLTDTGTALEPDVAAAVIKVSDGDDTALASVTKDGKSFAMGWEEQLPAPTVDGDTARYDIGDGQKLTVTALSQGFAQSVVLDQAPDRPLEYRIPIVVKGLTLSKAPSGRLLLKDTKNRLVAEAPAPMMWDSSKDERSGESKHLAEVETTVETASDGAQTLVLSPDAGFFEKDLTYPVTVDPTSTLAASTDTWVATNYNDSQVSSTELKSGTYDAGTTKARSYLKFDVTPFKGKHIIDSNLALYSYYSSTCDTTGAGTQVRRVTADWSSSAITWAVQPATTATGAVTNKAALGWKSSCPAGTVDFGIDTIVQAWADGAPNYGLRVAGASESDSTTWRRFRSANYVSGDGSSEPHLTVTYNSFPAGPSSTAIAPAQVNAYNGKRYVTSLNPTLSAKVTDPDGSRTKAEFEITPDPATANTTYTYTGSSGAVASGSTASLTVPANKTLPSGAGLRFRVRAHDGTDYGPWTGYTAFQLNTAKPVAPVITCETYAANSWSAKSDTAVNCKLDTESTDGAGYHWGLDNKALPNKKLDTTNGTGGDALTVSINPAEGWHTLYAKTVDSGGNLSTGEPSAYSFGVGTDGAAILSPMDGDDTARRITLAAKGLSSYTGVTWQYRRGEEDTWRIVPAVNVTASGSAVSAWPVKVTGGTSARLVWNVTDTLAEDGAVELRAAFTDGTTVGQTQIVEFTLDRDAGYAQSSDVGPGEVNLLTGDFTLSETDAEAFNSAVARTFSSRANSTDEEGMARIFGPGWISSIVGDVADDQYTQIRKTSATSVELLSADGSAIAFTATGTGGWATESGVSGLTLTGSLTGDKFTIKDTDANVTVFAKAAGATPTWVFSSSAAAVDDTTITVVSEAVSADDASVTRPKYVIAPNAGAKAPVCQADPSTKGCRVLEYVYSNATTATGGSLGDFKAQTQSIRLWATDPGATKATAETVARYAYDSSGRLREAWDPRITPALKTVYTYDSEGLVKTRAEANELPWTFTYGKAGSAPTAGAGMLLKASRPALEEGSTTTVSGTSATSVVYGVPLTGTRAPHQMDTATVSTWAQEEAPTDATAVLPADVTPASHNGSELDAGAYNRAAVTYLSANGDETNTATAEGALDVTEYDAFGNVVAELSAANRALALGTSTDAAAKLAELGLGELTTSQRAEALSDISVYSADGERLTDQYAPLRSTTLAKELVGSTSEATLPAGTNVLARRHVSYRYDEGRPADAAVSGLATSTTTGAYVEGYANDADSRTWSTRYDWSNGHQTAAVEDPTGKALTVATTYDSDGRVTSTRQAASSGLDAGTLTYRYYTADGNGICGGRTEWAGLLCETAPAATITGGGNQPAELVTTLYTYDRWGQPVVKRESANGVIRTTTTTTDSAGRTKKLNVTGGVGETTPATEYTYSAETGRLAAMSTGANSVSYGFDALGRQVTYQDGTGNTTTSYDKLDRVAKVTDSAPSTRTYAYDSSDRIKTLTDSVAGTFTATYDADDSLLTETLPGGLVLTVDTDTVGAVRAKEYKNAVGTTVLSDITSYTVHGQQAGRSQTDGSTTETDYSYDSVGRLTQVADRTAGGCTARSYTFDQNSNRTRRATASDDCDSTTADTVNTSTAYTYDSADRLLGENIAYDAYGRTMRTDGTELTYFTNDLVRSETSGTTRKTWSLDGVGRLHKAVTQTQDSGGAWTTSGTDTNHYGASGDSPSWSQDEQGIVTRNVTDPTGGLAAITSSTGDTVLQLTNLHGDIAVRLPLDSAKPVEVQRYDEYGNPLDGTAAATYGWLGGYQRSADTVSGLTLMGSRLYSPATGRFLQTDPVYGGNTNAYVYPADPVNTYDLDGRFVIAIPVYFAAEWALTALIALIAASVTAWICHTFGCSITVTGTGVRIPWPDKQSKTAKKYKKKTYWGYKIYRKNGGRIYKYGITRKGPSRPKSQIGSCERYYKRACGYKIIWRGKGWYNARMWEAGKITKYVGHHGHCPPGQLKSCR
ncbi:DNRLRE domain-containing protein [Streptomyces sp. NPDC101178]|uniref:DNRLRE domain-containing protein n=1 Tax=Streptomyces sp. NPDC101178 TaxID=3366124 RepID=UPI003826335B